MWSAAPQIQLGVGLPPYDLPLITRLTMSELIDSVKEARDLVRRNAVRLAESNPDLATERNFLVGRLDAAIERMVELEGLTSALPPDLGNIHDLPEELLSELSVAKTDELEDHLVTVINAYGGEANLDQILVGLYRKFKVVQKRRFIQNKLYRMEMVWSVEGKKGFYTTSQPQEAPESEPAYGYGYGSPPPDNDIEEEIPF